MNVISTEINGVLIIEPQVFGDTRGFFFESYAEARYKKVTGTTFVQDNISRSSYGVLRGLHFQKSPYAQAKLVQVLEGRILDVAVDLRPTSPTYGRHVSVEISAENHSQLFIPKGLAHGFVTLSNTAVLHYKCDEYYHPEVEGGIIWNDPKLDIKWPIPIERLILSEKDQKHPSLIEYERQNNNL